MNSFLQAIDDVSLEMFLTSVIIIILLLLGWYIDHRALVKQLKHIIRPERDKYKLLWRNNFWQGISTEFIGAAMTAFLFGIILLIFQQYQSIENDKADLILQMGSPDNSVAIEAERVARQKGWDEDGTLEGAYLGAANLSGVYLYRANLSGVYLYRANLEGASLSQANLERADLTAANLERASLSQVNLLGASLSQANLSKGYLAGANLRGANLINTNLSGTYLGATNLAGAYLGAANLENVTWVDKDGEYPATLPDGIVWTVDTDMGKFIDFDHPEYKATLEKINEIRKEMGLRLIDPETRMWLR